MIISMCIGCALEVYIWLSNKVFCNIHIGDTLNYLNSRCNTAKLLWVVIYVVCYGWFSPDLVALNICRQRLVKVDSPLWQRSLANENAVVCRQWVLCWRVCYNITNLLSMVLGFRFSLFMQGIVLYCFQFLLCDFVYSLRVYIL